MIVGWAVLSPLSKYKGWAPGPVGDMTTGARGWILWTALAIMVSDSFVSLLPIVHEFFLKTSAALRKREGFVRLPRTPPTPAFPAIPPEEVTHTYEEDSKDTETSDRLVPTRWVVCCLLMSVVLGTMLVWVVFGAEGIMPWATIIGFLMGGLLSLLGYASLV